MMMIIDLMFNSTPFAQGGAQVETAPHSATLSIIATRTYP